MVLCPVTGHFVQFSGFLEMSSSEIFIGVFSEKWLFLCVETAIPLSQSDVQRRPFPYKGFAGFTFYIVRKKVDRKSNFV